MDKITIAEWTAIYAAVLSTILAIVALVKWLFEGPKLLVTVVHPEKTKFSDKRTLVAIVSNVGKQSVVVRELEVEVRSGNSPWSETLYKSTFDEASQWNPATKTVPKPGDTNHFTIEPNVLAPNDEFRGNASTAEVYDGSKHWLRVTAKARGSKRKFSGWAGPKKPAKEEAS